MMKTINYCIIVILLFGSCKNVKWAKSFVTSDIIIYASQSYSKLNNELKISLKSNVELKIIWDSKAFTYECYNKEAKGIIMSNNSDIKRILNKIKYNQILIEDQNGNMRFFSDLFVLEGESKEVAEVNCMEEWYKSISLSKEKEQVITKKIKYKSDLMATNSSTKFRVYYLFKPNLIQRQKGFMEMIVKTNWLKLPPLRVE